MVFPYKNLQIFLDILQTQKSANFKLKFGPKKKTIYALNIRDNRFKSRFQLHTTANTKKHAHTHKHAHIHTRQTYTQIHTQTDNYKHTYTHIDT